MLIFSERNVKTVRYRLQTMPYIGLKNWDFVPRELKLVTTLDKFKVKSRLKVRKMSLTTLQNLPSTDRLHYVMPFNTD